MCVCTYFYRPYIIDLGSTNGTYVNNQRIDSTRYVELKEKVSCNYSLILTPSFPPLPLLLPGLRIC